MNLALRGIDSSNVKWNNEGSFLNDAHKDLKADFIIANPPFNDSDWSGELLRDDARWKILGAKLPPPPANANYAWIMHFLFHLAPNGLAGFVLAKGSLTTKTNNEGEIRKALIENDLVDCIANPPTKLFLNTQIPACLWFLRRNKQNRKGQMLFIDARNHGFYFFYWVVPPMPLARDSTVIARSEATKQSPTLAHRSKSKRQRGRAFRSNLFAARRFYKVRANRAAKRISTAIPHAADAYCPFYR